MENLQVLIRKVNHKGFLENGHFDFYFIRPEWAPYGKIANLCFNHDEIDIDGINIHTKPVKDEKEIQEAINYLKANGYDEYNIIPRKRLNKKHYLAMQKTI